MSLLASKHDGCPAEQWRTLGALVVRKAERDICLPARHHKFHSTHIQTTRRLQDVGGACGEGGERRLYEYVFQLPLHCSVTFHVYLHYYIPGEGVGGQGKLYPFFALKFLKEHDIKHLR
jgi:hypothetical protein